MDLLNISHLLVPLIAPIMRFIIFRLLLEPYSRSLGQVLDSISTLEILLIVVIVLLVIVIVLIAVCLGLKCCKARRPNFPDTSSGSYEIPDESDNSNEFPMQPQIKERRRNIPQGLPPTLPLPHLCH